MTNARPLDPSEVVRLLDATVTTLAAEIAALPEPLLAWHPKPGEWCIKEVLGHLVEAERRGFAGRIRLFLDRDEPRCEPWDQAEVARARRDCDGDARRLLDELRAMRAASRPWVEALGAPDLTRGGHHPVVGHLRVSDLLHEWVFHDRNHVKQALANVQVFAWPAMGNAQKFSAG